MVVLDAIETEKTNSRTSHIDQVSVLEMVRLMNEEDKKVALAVEKVLPEIAAASEQIYLRMKEGGRLIYIGCGTSGRLGVLDAAECPPTFGMDPAKVTALMAGGREAFFRAFEGIEDDREAGKRDVRQIGLSAGDTLVGLASSGRTPYVLGAMEYAREAGALTVGITSCPGSQIDRAADIGIAPVTGPEVITGSTRLKSGTAEKMVLNMLSTTVMIQMGKVYGNLMVDLKATNEKLAERAVRIVKKATGTSDARARECLAQCGQNAKTAIVMILLGTDAGQAEACLRKNGDRIQDVVKAVKKCAEEPV